MSRAGIGGPNTPEGKRRSSMNALRHGGRSQHRILADESEEDFENLRQNWFEYLQPIGFGEVKAVEELAQADWHFQRNKRRLDETEFLLNQDVDDENVPLHAFDWDAGQHKDLQLFTRYKTSSERSYQRALAVCQQMRKFNMMCADKVLRARRDREKQADRAARAEEKALQAQEKAQEKTARAEEKRARQEAAPAQGPLTEAETVFQGQRSPKKLKDKKPLTIEQWVEVRQNEEGVTTTALYPDNADSLRASGGTFIQRMHIDDWFAVTREEKESGSPHLLPTNHLPRPEARGECDCQACEVYRKRLEESESEENEPI